MKSYSYAVAAATGVSFCYGPLPTVIKRLHKTGLKKGDKPRLLLSFDDGPAPRNTPRLLETLREFNVPALFFLLGERAMHYPHIVRRILSEGHEVGFHAHSHKNQIFQNPVSTWVDFEKGLHALENISNQVRWYRPPHGCFNLISLWKARMHGLIPLLWHRHVTDWKKQDVEELLIKLREARVPGNILLLHDGSNETGGEPGAFDSMHEALKIFLSESLELGYEFVGAGEIEVGGQI